VVAPFIKTLIQKQAPTLLLQGLPTEGKSSLVANLMKYYIPWGIVTEQNLQQIIGTVEGDLISQGDFSLTEEETVISTAVDYNGTEITYITTPNGLKPKVYDRTRSLATQWKNPLRLEKNKPFEAKPWKDMDYNNMIVFDDLSTIADKPSSMVRMQVHYEHGFLGKPVPDSLGQKTMGWYQSKTMELLDVFRNIKRKFPLIVCCHLRRITLDPDKLITDDEVSRLAFQKSTNPDEYNKNKSKFSAGYKSTMLYPVVAGAALSPSFARDYTIVAHVYKEGMNEPRVRIAPPQGCADYPVMLRHPFTQAMKAGEIKDDYAISDFHEVLDFYRMQVEK
jgi:hypothetical protein